MKLIGFEPIPLKESQSNHSCDHLKTKSSSDVNNQRADDVNGIASLIIKNNVNIDEILNIITKIKK